MMFDSEKFKMNVNFTGKDYLNYLKYKDSTRTKFKKSTVIGILWLTFASIMALLLVFIIQSFYYIDDPIRVSSSEIIQKSNIVTELSWSDTLKILIWSRIDVVIILLLLIAVAWVFHGFGFYIIKI